MLDAEAQRRWVGGEDGELRSGGPGGGRKRKQGLGTVLNFRDFSSACVWKGPV